MQRNNSRGYYSEIITNRDQDSDNQLTGVVRRTKLLWQIRTELHSPVIPNINVCLKPTQLAPATRWTSFPEEKHIVRYFLKFFSRVPFILYIISELSSRHI